MGVGGRVLLYSSCAYMGGSALFIHSSCSTSTACLQLDHGWSMRNWSQERSVSGRFFGITAIGHGCSNLVSNSARGYKESFYEDSFDRDSRERR